MENQVADPFKSLVEKYETQAKVNWPLMQGFFRNCVPVTFQSVRFDLIDPDCQEDVQSCLVGKDSEQHKGLLLSGPVGTGKTSALYVILKYMLWQRFLELLTIEESRDFPEPTHQIVSGLGKQYAFVTHFELVRQLRAYYERSNMGDKQPRIFYVPLLFVDDLGRGYDDKSGWNNALLDEYFDYRYQHRLRVFATSNKTPQELRSWENWERVIDRLCDPYWMCTATMTGKSKRSEEWVDKQKESHHA